MRFGVGSEASMARGRGAGERCDRIRHLLHERPGRRRVELLERDLVGAHDVVGGRGDQQPERGQHAGPERNHDPTDAELRREVAGVQWPGPPEGDERRLPGIAALLRHVHAHRRPHRLVLVGDRHRPAAFFREQCETVRARWPDLTGRRVVHETIRAMINRQATDLLETSRAAIGAAHRGSVDEVRGHRTALIRFSAPLLEQHRELKQLLRKELYRHFRVFRMSTKAQRIVKDLFDVIADHDPPLHP